MVAIKEQSSSKGFAVLSSANVICKILSLVYLPIQTWLVGNSGNGVISVGFKLYMFIYALSTVGLPVVISKFVSEQVSIGDYRSAQKVFKCSAYLLIIFGVVCTLFTFFGAGLLDSICGEQSKTILMFMVIAPTFLFTSVASSLRGYFQGRHNMTPTAISQIIEQIVNSICTVAFEVVMLHYAMSLHKSKSMANAYTAAGSAAATAVAALCSAIFLGYLYIRFGHQRRHEIRHQTYDGPEIETGYIYRQLLKFSIPALVSCISTSAIDLIDSSSSIGLLEKAGYDYIGANALFGIYSLQYQRLLTLATMFIAPLVTAMIPALSGALVNNDAKYFRYKIRESYKLLFIVILPVVVGLTFLATPIITVVFPTARDGRLMVIFGMWIALLMAVQSIQAGVLLSLNHPMISPVNAIIGMIVKVICNYVLIPLAPINIYGALIGNALAFIIGIALNQYFIHHYLRTKLHTSKYLIIPTISSAIMGVLCLILFTLLNLVFGMITGAFMTKYAGVVASDIAVLLTVPFGAVVYAVLMIKSGGINSKDILKLPKGKKIYALVQRLPFLRSSV